MNPLDHAEKLARESAGNWRKFESFAWRDAPEDAAEWAIVYTHNRDSGLLDQSNAAFIDRAMAPFCEDDGKHEPDARSESHDHWACGWIDGYAIRVRDEHGLTAAWLAWCTLALRLENYPLLDEDDYSQREYDAAIEAIELEGRRFFDAAPPDGWASDVFTWLWENNPDELENCDDQGAYPSRDAIRDALIALELIAEDSED